MKRFVMRRLVIALCASGMFGLSTQVAASGFQLWEQDGASVGNYHAGYAAEADNASTAWYNPAGITRIKNQQFTLGGVGIATDFEYKGDVGVNTLFTPSQPQNVAVQGGTFSIVPNMHYVAPLNDWLGFGFSVDVPFGLKTDYGTSTELKYAATLSSITVVDISPSLGIQLTDKASIGIGFDVQKASAELDAVGTFLFPPNDTDSTNKANDTAYGYHAGALYQFTPDSRLGLSYHSQVVHHLSGSSKFIGPLADALNGGPIETSRSIVNLTLPPYTALSMFQKINPQIDLMGSIIYTQWSVFKELILQDVAGAQDFEASTTIVSEIPEYYRNTWNLSLGGNYHATDKIMLRSAIGYDETPVKDAYRNVQLPDNNRYVFSFGGRYQATKQIALDLGWTHLFFADATVNPPPQETGDQTVTTNGDVSGGADVYSAQVTWDIV